MLGDAGVYDAYIQNPRLHRAGMRAAARRYCIQRTRVMFEAHLATALRSAIIDGTKMARLSGSV